MKQSSKEIKEIFEKFEKENLDEIVKDCSNTLTFGYKELKSEIEQKIKELKKDKLSDNEIIVRSAWKQMNDLWIQKIKERIEELKEELLNTFDNRDKKLMESYI